MYMESHPFSRSRNQQNHKQMQTTTNQQAIRSNVNLHSTYHRATHNSFKPMPRERPVNQITWWDNKQRKQIKEPYSPKAQFRQRLFLARRTTQWVDLTERSNKGRDAAEHLRRHWRCRWWGWTCGQSGSPCTADLQARENINQSINNITSQK